MDLKINSDTWWLFSLLFLGTLALLIIVYGYIPYRVRKKTNAKRRIRYGKKIEKIATIEKKKSKSTISKLKEENDKLSADLKLQLEKLLSSEDTSPDLTAFYSDFDRIYPDFKKNIHKSYPSISSSELTICALLRLNMTSKEISRVLYITPDSVNKSRYRIRKKMALPTKGDLAIHILNI